MAVFWEPWRHFWATGTSSTFLTSFLSLKMFQTGSPKSSKMLLKIDQKTWLVPKRFWERFSRKRGPLDPRELASRLGGVWKIVCSPFSHFSPETIKQLTKILPNIRSISNKNQSKKVKTYCIFYHVLTTFCPHLGGPRTPQAPPKGSILEWFGLNFGGFGIHFGGFREHFAVKMWSKILPMHPQI